MPSLKNIKITYSSPPSPSNSSPPTLLCDEPNPPPPPPPKSTCSTCQHKNRHPPPPAVARPPPPPGAVRPPPPPFVARPPPPPCAPRPPPPPPPPLSVVSPPPPPPPPQSVSAPPPAAVTPQTPNIQPSILVPAAAPWIYPPTAQSPYFAPPPLAAQGGGNTGLILGTSLSGLFFLSFLAFGLNFLAKKMVKSAPATNPAETHTGPNLKDLATDVENPGEAVSSLPNIEEGPPKDQNPLPPSNESGDPQKNDKSKSEDQQKNEEEKEDHDRKKKSTDGLIKMLKDMNTTLLLMTKPGYQKSMAPGDPERTSTVEDDDDGLEEEETYDDIKVEEEEEEANDDIKEEEEETVESSLPQNKYKESKGIRSKTLEDSKMPVKGRPAPRDSNRSKKAKAQSKSTTVNTVPTSEKVVKPFVDKETVNDSDVTNIEDERQDADQALGEIEAEKERDELEETEGVVEQIDRNKESDKLDEGEGDVGDIDADVERDENVGDIDADVERDELDEGEGDVGDVDAAKEREELDKGEGEGKADETVVPRNIEKKPLQEHEAKHNRGEKGGPVASNMKQRVKRANKPSPSSNVVMTPAQRKAAMQLAKESRRGGGEAPKTEDDPDKASGFKEGEDTTEQPVDGGGNVDDHDVSLQDHACVPFPEMSDLMSAMDDINPLASIGLGSHWNVIVKLVKKNYQLLQALKKKNERMQRKIDTLTASSVHRDYEDKEDVLEGEKDMAHRAPNPNLLQGTELENDYDDDDANQGTELERENEDKAGGSMQEIGQDEEMMNDEKDLLMKQDEGMVNDDNVGVKKQTLPQESKEEQDMVNFSGLNEKTILEGKKDVLKQIPVNKNKIAGKRGSNPSSKTGATTGSTTAIVKRGGKSQVKKMVNEDDVVSQQVSENAGELPQKTEQIQGNDDNDAEGLTQETEQMQVNDDNATELQHETVQELQNDEIAEESEQLQENDDDPGEETEQLQTEQGQENDDSATDLPHNPEQGIDNYYNPQELLQENVNEDDANLPQDSNEDEGMMDVSGIDESKRLAAGIKKKVDKHEFNPSGKTQFQKGKSNSAAKKGGVLEKQQVIATPNLSTSSALSSVMGFAASNEDEGILSFTNPGGDNEDEAWENKESEHNIIVDGLDTVGSMKEKIPTDLQQVLKRNNEPKKSVASKHPSTNPPYLPTTVGNIELEGIPKFINPQELAKGEVLGQSTGEIKDLLHKDKHKGKKPGSGKATTKRQTPGMDDFNKTRELFQGKIDQESQLDAETTMEVNDGADEEVVEEEIAEEEGVAAAEEEEDKHETAEVEVATEEEEEGVEEEAAKEESNASTI